MDRDAKGLITEVRRHRSLLNFEIMNISLCENCRRRVVSILYVALEANEVLLFSFIVSKNLAKYQNGADCPLLRVHQT